MKQADIARLLPAIFQRTLYQDNLLYALLGAMEALHAPSEKTLTHIDTWFDPHRTSDPFVPFLSSWVDLDWLWQDANTGLTMPSAREFASGSGRLRELVAAAAFLSKWRGTAKGLKTFLEIATGVEGFVINEQVSGPNAKPLPYHIQVMYPEAAAPYRQMIERIVEHEKPAYVTYELASIPAPEPAGQSK